MGVTGFEMESVSSKYEGLVGDGGRGRGRGVCGSSVLALTLVSLRPGVTDLQPDPVLDFVNREEWSLGASCIG